MTGTVENFSAMVSGEELGRGPLDQILHLPHDVRTSLQSAVQQHSILAPIAAALVAPAAKAAPVLPDYLDFKTGAISFKNGVPVGGWAQVRLYKNGNWAFSGHFHDSGFPSYNVDFAWVFVASNGAAFTFKKSVRVHGTIEPGSRNGDWDLHGQNPAIAKNWAAFCANYHWRWQANVNMDLSVLLKQIQDVMKVAGTIIATVIAIV
ncbi:MAG: hypothetical protein LBF16_07295 [Pseudomonadales bacterium]|jgi:hypothetical protein|nr:hypothetical protein [Pseudomonadales bacterium]